MRPRPGTAKTGFIAAFFDQLQSDIAYLGELAAVGRTPEAVTLALVYIDRLAQKLEWPARSSARAFVNALLTYADDGRLGTYHRRALFEGLMKRGGRAASVAEKHAAFLAGRVQHAYHKEEFLALLKSKLSADEMVTIRSELWRGTLAYAIYFALRNPAIHGVGPSGGLAIAPRPDGEKLASIGIADLSLYCERLAAEAHRRSRETGQWFGDDRTVSGV